MNPISEIEKRKLIIQCVELSFENDPNDTSKSLEISISSYKKLAYIDGEVSHQDKDNIRYWHHRIYTKRTIKPTNQYKNIRG
jgi:hypothetical protein